MPRWLRVQLMDGDKVIHSEDATVHYIALLTAAENSWESSGTASCPLFLIFLNLSPGCYVQLFPRFIAIFWKLT